MAHAPIVSGLPSRVRIVEVGPRDGLQNEAVHVPTEAKVRLIELLADAGLETVEATSFVSPRAVPQLADAEQVVRAVRRRPGVRYPVLVPNQRGLERALASGAREIAVFTAATDAFALRNVNATVAESLQRLQPVVAEARRLGLWTRGYVSVAFGCPFAGSVEPAWVVRVAASLVEMGVDEVALADTIGAATPRQVEEALTAVLRAVPVEMVALHFHDTRGAALANVLLGLQYGVSTYDSAVGGLGGCPFAPGATGNVATEDLLVFLDGMRIATGVDLSRLVRATEHIASYLGHPVESRCYRATRGAAKRRQGDRAEGQE